MSEQYLKPGGGPRRNRSPPPSLSVLNAFFSCENSQVLVVLGSIVSTVESQGTSHSAGSIQIMFIGKGRKGFLSSPSEQLLSRQNAMLQKY